MTGGIQPITDDERRARIEKARRLMRENKIGAIVLEGGSSLFYFTGTRWPQATAPCLVLPAKGEPAWVVPKPMPDARSGAVRTWAEGGDPYQKLAQVLKDRGADGRDRASKSACASPSSTACARQRRPLEFVSADPVTVGCRVIKSPAEIALMQRANDITIAAYKAALATLREGMTQRDLSANIAAAYRALGSAGDAMVIFGKYTAFPHGSIQPQQLREGDVVLIDDGCTVDGYQIGHHAHHGLRQADGAPARGLGPGAQGAGRRAGRGQAGRDVRIGGRRRAQGDHRCRLRSRLQGAGPAAPHRPRHRPRRPRVDEPGEGQQDADSQPGMCFSDEPTIAIYGEFGVRLEDCMYITEDGARMFTKQSPAIDQPFG